MSDQLRPPLVAAPPVEDGDGIVAIIALYNGAPFIAQAVESVLAQTRMPDEFLVVDDGSTDDGPAIVEAIAERDPRVRLLRKANGGQSSARNHGVRNSVSPYIALLDQDDGWYPHHLEHLSEPFRDRSRFNLGWVYSDLDRCDRSGELRTRRLLSGMATVHPKTDIDQCLSEDMFILPSASLIARRAFDHVGGFDERLSGYEDDDLFLRMLRAGYDNVFLPEALSFWRIYDASTSFSPRMAVSRMIYFDKLVAGFPDDPNNEKADTSGTIAPRFLGYVVQDLRRAIRRGDEAGFERARADVARITPHLGCRQGWLANAILRTPWRLARRLYGRGIFGLAARALG